MGSARAEQSEKVEQVGTKNEFDEHVMAFNIGAHPSSAP
jgi:hypothetical protein